MSSKRKKPKIPGTQTYEEWANRGMVYANKIFSKPSANAGRVGKAPATKDANAYMDWMKAYHTALNGSSGKERDRLLRLRPLWAHTDYFGFLAAQSDIVGRLDDTTLDARIFKIAFVCVMNRVYWLLAKITDRNK